MATAEELVFIVGVAVTVASIAAVGASRRDAKSERKKERERHEVKHLQMEERWQDIARRLDHNDRNQTQMIGLMKDQAAVQDEALLELVHLTGEIDPDARERMLRRRPDIRRA